MASTWMAAARATRLVIQQYGAPSFVAGSLVLSSGSLLSPPTLSIKTDAASLLYQYTGYHVTTCEAAASSKSTLDDDDDSSDSKSQSSGRRHHFNNKKAAEGTASIAVRRRMTNVGRFSLLSETMTNPSVPVLVLCLSGKPWTARDFVSLYDERKISEKHERFRAVVDPQTHHFVFRDTANKESLPVHDMLSYPQIYRRELKELIMDALLQPLDLSETLWEAVALTGGNIGQSGALPASTAARTAGTDAVESLLLFRAHHCMADGVSLGAIFGDLMDEGKELQDMLQLKIDAFRRRKKSWWQKLQIVLYYWCWGSIRALWYQAYLYVYSFLLSPPNPWRVLQRTQDPDLDHQRTLSWVQIASVDEVKQVADYFTRKHRMEHPGISKNQKMTVNDIFCSCITGATTRLFQYHRRKDGGTKQQGTTLALPYLNLVMPVHMQGGILLPGQSMGNKIGAIVSQVPAEATSDVAQRLHAVHETLWTRKQTPTAVLSYLVATTFGGTLGTILGPRLTSWIFSKAHANASVVVTNVRGLETAAHLGGRKVESNLGFLPLPPGVPIGMVIMSYDQKITLTIMAEPWAVPDADQFLSWIVEEYQELLRRSREKEQ